MLYSSLLGLILQVEARLTAPVQPTDGLCGPPFSLRVPTQQHHLALLPGQGPAQVAHPLLDHGDPGGRDGYLSYRHTGCIGFYPSTHQGPALAVLPPVVRHVDTGQAGPQLGVVELDGVIIGDHHP